MQEPVAFNQNPKDAAFPFGGLRFLVRDEYYGTQQALTHRPIKRFSCMLNRQSLPVALSGRHKPIPKRSKRGINLIATSLLMSVFVLSLSTYVQGLAKKSQNSRAEGVMSQLVSLSKDLDFWVHYNRADIPALMAGKAAYLVNTSDLNHPINTHDTAAPYLSRSRIGWDINYVILNLPDDPLPYGAILAKPNTPREQVISALVAAKISSRSNSSQAITTHSDSQLRDILAAEGVAIAAHDLVFLTYTFNGLNPSYVLRQEFAGIAPSSMDANLTFLATSDRDIENVNVMGADTGVAGKVSQGAGGSINAQAYIPPSLQVGAAPIEFKELRVRGNLTAGRFAQNASALTTPLVFNTNRIITDSTAQTNSLTASSPSKVDSLSAPAVTVSAALTAQNGMTAQGVTTDHFFAQNAKVNAGFKTTTATINALVANTLQTTTTRTGSCTGC